MNNGPPSLCRIVQLHRDSWQVVCRVCGDLSTFTSTRKAAAAVNVHVQSHNTRRTL